MGCATERVVSFQSDIYPILKENCIQCHMDPAGIGYLSVGLSMVSHESLMHGTFYGPVVVPGDSKRSILNKLIEGRAGNYMRMPHLQKAPLTEDEIKIIQAWVDQDAKNN